MKSVVLSLFLVVAGLSQSNATIASAAELSGQSRSYTHSCGYFSANMADVIIDYRAENLGWGVIVELIYGFEGYVARGGGAREAYEWRDENRLTLSATAPYTWSAHMTVPVHYRSSANFNEQLNFVFRIIHPDGRIAFDNGTDSPWGFYKLKINRGFVACIDAQNPKPEFLESEITTTSRY